MFFFEISMHPNFEMVYSSSNHIEAGIVKSALESEGIRVFERGMTLNTITAEVSLEGGMIELYVHKNELEEARKFLDAESDGEAISGDVTS